MTKAYKNLIALNAGDLAKRKTDLEKELGKLRRQPATGASQKNPYAVRNNRRAIARILTLTQQRKGNEHKQTKVMTKHE